MTHISNNFNNLSRKTVLAVSLVSNKSEAIKVIENFRKQTFQSKKLIIITEERFDLNEKHEIEIIHQDDLEQHFFEEFGDNFENISYLHHDCEYGTNYLTDMINGSKFSNGLPISKLQHQYVEHTLTPFTKIDKISAVSSMFPMKSIMNKPVLPNLRPDGETLSMPSRN